MIEIRARTLLRTASTLLLLSLGFFLFEIFRFFEFLGVDDLGVDVDTLFLEFVDLGITTFFFFLFDGNSTSLSSEDEEEVEEEEFLFLLSSENSSDIFSMFTLLNPQTS